MQCPGQDNRYWDGEAVFEVPCPHCGNELEFFKDDSQLSCRKCGNKVLNPRMDFGCAAYCSHAEQCLGAMPAELIAKQKNLFKDKLALSVRRQLPGDDALFKLANQRAGIAEQLCRDEQRGDMAAVVAAALLFDTENPGAILEELKSDADMLTAVERLIQETEPETIQEQASQDILRDACLLLQAQNDPDAAVPVLNTLSAKKTFESM